MRIPNIYIKNNKLVKEKIIININKMREYHGSKNGNYYFRVL